MVDLAVLVKSVTVVDWVVVAADLMATVGWVDWAVDWVVAETDLAATDLAATG